MRQVLPSGSQTEFGNQNGAQYLNFIFITLAAKATAYIGSVLVLGQIAEPVGVRQCGKKLHLGQHHSAPLPRPYGWSIETGSRHLLSNFNTPSTFLHSGRILRVISRPQTTTAPKPRSPSTKHRTVGRSQARKPLLPGCRSPTHYSNIAARCHYR